MRRSLITLSLAALVAIPASATEPDFIGDFGSWSAFTYSAGGAKVCYVASKPTAEEGDYQRRGEVYTLVTHRPADKVRGEVSIIAGYDYKKGSDPQARIGGQTIHLFAEGGTAWADDRDERRLVAAMKAGSEMIVKGTSTRGTETTDTYSLVGFTKAMDTIDTACPR